MTAIGNTTRHGFTGHEHLESVNLIHMNGRVYEPVVGRMLSPDAVIQIGSAQSVNCYAYVWNNPLTRTDPSGWVVLDAADSWRQFFEWIAKLQRDYAEWEAAVERKWRREKARLRRSGPPERRQRPGGADGEGQPQGQQPIQQCTVSWNFYFGQFADQIEENRFDLGATLGTLFATEAIGTMPKTPSELRGLGVPKSELSPITSQLSRWSDRLDARWMRDLGRTTGGKLASGAATFGVVFEGFYDIGLRWRLSSAIGPARGSPGSSVLRSMPCDWMRSSARN